MRTRFYVSLLFLLVGITTLSAQNKKNEPVKHRIVIQFNDADSISQVRVLMQAENIRKVWPEAEVEIVCLGGGLDMLTTKSCKVNDRVDQWKQKGVVFAACNNTMNFRGIKPEDLIPQAVVIPSAMIELASKQEAGWSYVRGGK